MTTQSTTPNIFSKVGNFFKTIGHAAYAVLVKVFGQTAVDQVEQDLEVILREDVITIFADAITAAEALQAGTSADKKAAAFAQITKDLKAQGIDLLDRSINLGIELVVGLIKSKTPAATAPTTAS